MRVWLDAVWLAPRNIAVALLIAYRTVISPLYGDVCKFHPTCSRYALDSFGVFGFVRGIYMTLRRLGRCHPWSLGGIDDVPENPRFRYRVTRFGFIVPSAAKGF